MATSVPVYISYGGRALVVWECDKYTVGRAGLDLVLKELDIEESDYFGLQYKGKNGTKRWLNSRNPALRELKIAGATSPYKLELCVKFYVPPKQLFQSETRLAYYTDIRQRILEGRFAVTPSFMPRVISLMAQIDLGDATEDMSSVYKEKYPQIWDDSQMDSVYVRHLALAKSAKHKVVSDFLREVSSFGDYGVEYHRVLSNNGKVLMIQLGVKDLGIFMDEDPTRGTKIPLKDLNGAKVKGKSIFFSTNKYKAALVPCSPTVQNNRVIADLELGFAEETDARVIYRALLERHLFYCRVSAADLTETPRFNSKWELLKAKIHPNKADKYRLFSYDVCRTAKEAYAHNKKLFSSAPMDNPDASLPQSPLVNSTTLNSVARSCNSQTTLAQRRTMTEEDMETHVYFGKPRRPPVRTGSLKGERQFVRRSTAIGIPQTPKTAFETSSSGSEKFTFSPPSSLMDTHYVSAGPIFSPLLPTPTPGLTTEGTFNFPSSYSLKLKDAKPAPQSVSSSSTTSSSMDDESVDFSDTHPLIPDLPLSTIHLEPVPLHRHKSRKSSDKERLNGTYYHSHGANGNHVKSTPKFAPVEGRIPPRPLKGTLALHGETSESDFNQSSSEISFASGSPDSERKLSFFAEDDLVFSESLYTSLMDEKKASMEGKALQSDWECRLCMDAHISTVFIPCGHMLFCRGCAHRVRACPLCKSDILLIQTVYLPMAESAKSELKNTPSPTSLSLSPSISPSASRDIKFEDL